MVTKANLKALAQADIGWITALEAPGQSPGENGSTKANVRCITCMTKVAFLPAAGKASALVTKYASRMIACLVLAPLFLFGAGKPVHVPYNTRIKVLISDIASPAQLQTGDRVHLIVAENVIVGGYVVVEKDATGLATVDSASSTSVHLTFDWVHDAGGGKVGITGGASLGGGVGGSQTFSTADISDAMSKGNRVAATNNAPQPLQQAAGRVTQTFGILFGGSQKAVATPSPIVAISVFVKNPSGVDVTATKRSEDDDTGVK